MFRGIRRVKVLSKMGKKKIRHYPLGGEKGQYRRKKGGRVKTEKEKGIGGWRRERQGVNNSLNIQKGKKKRFSSLSKRPCRLGKRK